MLTMPNGHETMRPAVQIWYDGACPLCLHEIALMRRLDKRSAITFVDASDETSVCPIDRATLLAKFHAREGETLHVGAAAFAAMWRAIPVLRPLGLIARNRWILALLERLYLIFLKFRPRLQALVAGRARP
jgi:predicted DCC family thiol-disulfide oxidoreductase YuxK